MLLAMAPAALQGEQLPVQSLPPTHRGVLGRGAAAQRSLPSARRPMLIDMNKVYRQSNLENLDQAFTVAERDLGVTRLLDPEGRGTPPVPPCPHAAARGRCPWGGSSL